MKREEFVDYIYDNVSWKLEEYCLRDEARLHLEGEGVGQELVLAARTRNGNCPLSFHMDKMYMDYLAGKPEKEILKMAVDSSLEHIDSVRSADKLNLDDYRMIQDKISVRIYSNETAVELQETCLCERFGYFSLAYQIDVFNGSRYCVVFPVQRDFLRRWGVPLSEVRKNAFQRLPWANILLAPIDHFGKEEWNPEKQNYYYNTPEERKVEEIGAFCLTNSSLQYGAALILNRLIRCRVADILGCSYYILPTSVHEMVIVPDRGNVREEELAGLLHEVNTKDIRGQERVCDEVFYYDWETRKFFTAREHSAREKRNLLLEKDRLIRNSFSEGMVYR